MHCLVLVKSAGLPSMKHGGKRPRAGRPKSGRVAFPIRVVPKIARLIDRLAFVQNKSRGRVVEEQFNF